MTKVAEALDRVARQCSVTPPSSWATATRAEHVDIRDDFWAETIEEIQDRVDLPAPIGKQIVITGTGDESYSLPSNYHRLAQDDLAVYETTTLRRAGTPVSTDGAWTHLNTIGSAGTNRYYAIEGYPGGYTIKFERDLAAGNSVTVSYVSNVYSQTAGGAEISGAFQNDDDVLLLPRRVVELGAIARFRYRKGFDATVERAQFEYELGRIPIRLRGIRKISFGGGVRDCKPMRYSVPDYIPDA